MEGGPSYKINQLPAGTPFVPLGSSTEKGVTTGYSHDEWHFGPSLGSFRGNTEAQGVGTAGAWSSAPRKQSPISPQTWVRGSSSELALHTVPTQPPAPRPGQDLPEGFQLPPHL